MPTEQDNYEGHNLGEFEAFKLIIARLRSLQGCPWDRKQTHDTLKRYLLEESYEVLEAIEGKNPAELCEELGDLWLQIMLHTQIAIENNEFTFEDVISRINKKLLFRHPHVFGSQHVDDAEAVPLKWEELKGKEKPGNDSILAGVPDAMPALLHSDAVQKRAAAVGFDWATPTDILKKLTEEVEEFFDAPGPEERAREFGDILFTLVNIGRRMDIEAEFALRETNTRFSSRFKFMENLCKERGLDMRKMTLKELDGLWVEAKESGL